ncbi:hypothetical protein LF908_06995 [Bifidobacterium pseudolongum]|uniref:hypothetical protein n=1 Tax=Bifidobacterium pseudolongum TaxID=1694 RepID=UPI001F0EC01C|nr:hypothetical protein [Bifidobacterium pseudolongum]MCH4851954.1 hypothetical protein [Bifidobacterium pseudolongum]
MDEFYEEWDAIPVDIHESRRNSYPLLQSHLRQTASQMMRRCARAHIPYVYCGSTALRLLGVETPEDLSGPGNAWDNAPPRATKQPRDALHVVVRTAGERHELPGVRMHVWKGLAADSIQQFANGVQCLRPAAAWVSVAMDATMLQLIQIAESMERYGLATLADLRAFAGAHRFHGKRRCLRALAIARPGSASVKETELRVRLELRGLPAFEINYAVPGSAYDSRTEHTVDLAIAKYRLGLEYQGDQHRSDYRQYRRDREKLGALAALGWSVFEVTQADLNSEEALDRLAMHVACVIAQQTGKEPRIARMTYARIAGAA